jgi:hypothetical protein
MKSISQNQRKSRLLGETLLWIYRMPQRPDGSTQQFISNFSLRISFLFLLHNLLFATRTNHRSNRQDDDRGNNNNNNNGGGGDKPRSAPDHGKAHVPGAGPMDMAPKSLDHFQRGYKERAEMRDKQFCDSRNKNRGHPVDKHNSRGNNSGHRGLPQPVIMGMNIQGLVDRLLSPRCDIDAELDKAYKEHAPVFACGKASTAIISAGARQRNMRLSENVWKWMDRAGLEKNTFHYNAMMSAVGFRQTLTLLQEMTDRKIDKNEVT